MGDLAGGGAERFGRALSATAAGEWEAFEDSARGLSAASLGPTDAAVVAVVAPSGGTLLSVAAAQALTRSFEALGCDWSRVRVVGSPRGRQAPAIGWPRLLAWEVEVVDPGVVLVFGPRAAKAAAAAWPKPRTGQWAALGRPILTLPDPDGSLSTAEGKQQLWSALKDVAQRLPRS